VKDWFAHVHSWATFVPRRDEDHMANKSPRQHQPKKAGKSLKEKRVEKKAKQSTKRTGT
jgi:hypothetical protein